MFEIYMHGLRIPLTEIDKFYCFRKTVDTFVIFNIFFGSLKVKKRPTT
jgi:hypothetical protein